MLTNGGVVSNVLKQNVECLEELNTHIVTTLLSENLQEERLHVLLQKKTTQKKRETS